MSLTPGTRLGVYEVATQIGEGLPAGRRFRGELNFLADTFVQSP